MPDTFPLSAAKAADLAACHRALGDPVRLRILSVILAAENQESCVNEVAAHFDLTQPTVSHHLKVLHEAKLVNRERRGNWIYYSAAPNIAAMVTRFLPAI
ncbi:hypothetical protein BSZ39_02575 [Bowdeniella nasicola]|uniref:HTH arsR-type domain-containing protein n=1 Tax=Bowdeniella nasicola TaxID=208480 RepID=A0A1Q5Q4R8_9ACTO|nr:metalloregulator ArsR/SmtB family transcription factor [Bowdeniella nasicola]OKL54689.1 hypothetical protein BSZ39_02575 [Bowdeniella nasicola]